MITKDIVLAIPAWVDELAATFEAPLDTDDARMALTIALSRENVARGGGPFGATIFEGSQLVAAGVNLVLASGLTIAHAEIVAMMRAQKARRVATGSSPIPGTKGGSVYHLFASTEPCVQCFGALVWSGIQKLTCGANTEDAEAIGFDEGPKPADWVESLEVRGVSVVRDLRRAEARQVLDDYHRRGGTIYGGGTATRG